MNRLILICLLFGVAAVFGSTLPVEFLEWRDRIIGGHDAIPGQFPYQVSLRTSTNEHFCGGSIINNCWVLTAAHCTIERALADTRVIVGAHLLNSGGIVHNVARIVNHELFNPDTLENDVSLVHTATNIAFNNLAVPIGLGASFVNTGSGALVSGWGQVLPDQTDAPNNLQWMRTNIITLADCRRRVPNAADIFDSTICGLSPRGQGTCFGDSGGPLVHGGRLQGVVSWVYKPCGDDIPDGFARVSWYHTWILNNAV